MKKVVLLVCLFFIPLTLVSETQHRFRVFVHVFEAKQADLYDTYTKDYLETKLKKELLLLEDVDIVEFNEYRFSPNWHFSLQVCYLQNTFTDNSDTKRGFAIAFNFSERVPLSYFKGNRYPESNRSPIYTHYLGIDYRDINQLDHYCAWVASEMDKKVLAPRRKLIRELLLDNK